MHFNKIISDDIASIANVEFIETIDENSCYLITGACGFIATYIIETLLYINEKQPKNILVYALARDKNKFWKKYKHHKKNKYFKFINSDVTKLEQALESINFTHIIHAASNASPKFYGTDPVGTYAANTIGTHNLLSLAHKIKVKRFIYISSSEVYGSSQSLLTSESDFGYLDPTNVRACYAEGKRMGENMCISWVHQHKVPALIVRPFHTYGPGMHLDDGRVYADFVRSIVNKESIALSSDGLAERAFCYLSDAIKGIFQVLNFGVLGEAYNLGNPNETYSIKDLALLLQKSYPKRCNTVTLKNQEPNSSYISSSVSRISPNIEKIANIGWQPNINITDGFSRTIESYLNELD